MLTAKIEIKGLNEYTKALSRLSTQYKKETIGRAIYGAAGIVADEIRTQLSGVPTDEHWGTPEHPASGPRKIEAQAIADGLGIAPIQEDGAGNVNVKIGFDGYSRFRTKRWPDGQPIPMLVRSVERGTSFMKSNPFVKRAVAAKRKAAVDHMKQTIDEATKNIMEGD